MPAVLVAVGIAIVSLIEKEHIPTGISLSDEAMHGMAYALLAVCLAAALFHNGRTAWQTALWSVPAVTLYGGLLELLQAYCTLTRSGDWVDLAADLIGAVAGFVCVWIAWICYRHIHTT